MTLTEFLMARITEDEATAGAEPACFERRDMRIEWGEVGAIEEVLLIGEARLRAECAAKRAIFDAAIEVARVELSEPFEPVEDPGVNILYALALPYADHPDYLSERRREK